MANSSSLTFYRLMVFLLGIAVFALATASWRYYEKSRFLQLQVDELKASQVMLMVPKEQAAVIANWMQQHPEQTASLLDAVKPVAQGEMTEEQALDKEESIAPSLENAAPAVIVKPEKKDNSASATSSSAVSAENIKPLPKGVKVVPLEHGGIIITTRKVDNDS